MPSLTYFSCAEGSAFLLLVGFHRILVTHALTLSRSMYITWIFRLSLGHKNVESPRRKSCSQQATRIARLWFILEYPPQFLPLTNTWCFVLYRGVRMTLSHCCERMKSRVFSNFDDAKKNRNPFWNRCKKKQNDHIKKEEKNHHH